MFLRRLKLRAPAMLPSWIARADTGPSFAAGIRILAIVAAAGYGKTVFASQVAAAWRGPLCWYTCDDDDADLAVFSAHLHAALAAIERTADNPPPAASATPKEVAINAAERLAAVPDTLVVFDDVHVLNGRALEALTALVARAVPAGVCFVLSGREMPLKLESFAVRGALATRSLLDLTFDDAQSRSYLNAASDGRLGPQRIDELVRRIAGWPAGLALAAAMPARAWEGDAPPAASLELLFDYLAAEVLAGLDPDERRFLLETSVLDDLEVDVCNVVAGVDDAYERLTRLARRGLFIARSRADAFEVHRLFAAVLRDRLEREYSPGAIAERNERAANVFAARGTHVKAIEHWIAARQHDRAANALARIAPALHGAGHSAQLERLLAGVGPERVEADPILAIARGRLQHAAGAWDAALSTLARAESTARERALPDVAAEAVRAMAPIMGARGEYERLGNVLEATLASPLSADTRTTVSITFGAYLLDRGRLDEVLTLYERIAPAVAQLKDQALHGVVLHNTGAAHMRRGDPCAAIGFYERALNVKRANGQRVSALVTLGNLCIVLRTLGDFAAATRVAAECTHEARELGNAAMLSHALECAGSLALQLGDIETAATNFTEACAACDPSDTLFLPDALHGTALVALRRSEPVTADAACTRALALLRSPGDEQRRAAIVLTRGRAALLAHQPGAALTLARDAFALAACGPDRLATATVGLEVAALAAAVARASTPELAAEAVAFGRAAADAALTHKSARDYGFLERTYPDAVAAARSLRAPVNPLKLELFGPLRVWVAGTEVATTAWKRRKAREILAYLICERGRLVPRARLIDTFWPDVDADSASDNLRVCVSAIRRVVGDVVRFESGSYAFTAPAGAVIDIAMFDARIAAARRARDGAEIARASAAYADALAIYAGDLLDGFEDGVWHLRERARLRDGALEAARTLIGDTTADDDVRARAIDRLLQLAPFDVEAMRARLERLTAARRIGEARTEYEHWRERYVAAFGDPPPEFWQAPRLTVAPRAS
jgi:LuxR family maltose regulon positive regulatory protein